MDGFKDLFEKAKDQVVESVKDQVVDGVKDQMADTAKSNVLDSVVDTVKDKVVDTAKDKIEGFTKNAGDSKNIVTDLLKDKTDDIGDAIGGGIDAIKNKLFGDKKD